MALYNNVSLRAVPSFELYVASSLEELFEIISDGDGETYLYAGGTDMMPMMRRGKIKPKKVVDISGLSELNYIKKEGTIYRIGSLTTIHQLSNSPAIPHRYFSLHQLAKYFGAETTRHMATVGGNLASGGERDLPAILTSLDASVKVVSKRGERIAHPLKLNIKKDEVIVEAFFEDWGLNSFSLFRKFEKRASNGIGIVTAAISMRVVDGLIEKLRVVLNRVEGRKMDRLYDLEEELTGNPLSEEIVEKAVEKAVSNTKPASDFRASSGFRKHVSKVLLIRGLMECWIKLRYGGADED